MPSRRELLIQILGVICAPMVPKAVATAMAATGPAAVAPAAPVEGGVPELDVIDFSQIMGYPNTYGWWKLGRKDGEDDDFETFAREYEQWALGQAKGD